MLRELFLTVAGISWQTSLVILVVLLVRLLLRKLGAPTVVSYALWAVVLFRLLCPISLEGGLGVIPAEMAEKPREVIIEDYAHIPPETVLLAPVGVLGDALNGGMDGMDFRYDSEEYGQEGYGRIFPGDLFVMYLGALWPVGVAALVAYCAVSYVKLRRKLIGAVPLEGNIRLADHITSPFVMGLFRPKIYLPSELPENEREYIILHERHHIRRLDHVVKVLAFAALCIHWFNPLVWLAFYLSGKDMEMSCDEAVIKKLGTDIRADYSASLLSLATGRRILAAMPLAFGEGDTGSRIKNLAKWKKPAVWITVVAVILCAAVIVLCATNSGGGNNLKVRIASGGIEVTCRFDDEVDDWAVYEDIYLEGELISSKTILINGEHPKAADPAKKLNYVFKMNMTGADGGGFASPLRFSAVDGNETITSREVDLPYETYGAFMTCAGDHEAFPMKRKLGANDQAILFSAVLSLDEGTTVNVEDGVVGYNDTVVQYRLVTADYVRDWSETINGNLYYDFYTGPLRGDDSTMIYVSEIYVSERCLYLTPYSSYGAIGGDSGYRYLMGDNGVYKARHDGSGEFALTNYTLTNDWENWGEFPWTDEEWKALFWTDLWAVDVSGYEKREYCALSQNACLLRMDGALWLVEFAHNEQMGKHIYSIYQLVPERAKGSAQWEFDPTSASSASPFASVAFPFVFDMEYDEISAVCTERPLTDLDGFEWPKGQTGIYSPETDYALTFPKGHTVYWCATDADRVPAKQSTIHFTVHEGEQMVCAGTIYIHSWVEAETGNRTYSATLVGTGLVMEQNPDGGAIIRLGGKKGPEVVTENAALIPTQYGIQTEVANEEDGPSLSFEELAVGDEVNYSSPIVFAEDGGWLEYSFGYVSPGVTVDFGLRAADGTEISQTVTGGHANGRIEHIPAGSYVLFVRNSSEPEVHAPMYTLELGVMNFRCSGVTEEANCRIQNALDRAVTQAVHAHFTDGDPTGLLNATNHVLLDSTWEENTVTAYVLAMHKTYRHEEYKTEPQPVDSKFAAMKLTFTVEDGKYTLTDYWEPRRLFYESDLRAQFTPFAAQEVLGPGVYEVYLDHQCDNVVN